jgi:hypothetical protein
LLGLALARPAAAVPDGVLEVVVVNYQGNSQKENNGKKVKQDLNKYGMRIGCWREMGYMVRGINFDTYAWALGSAARAGGRQLTSSLGCTWT